jgi:hypothetical protein
LRPNIETSLGQSHGVLGRPILDPIPSASEFKRGIVVVAIYAYRDSPHLNLATLRPLVRLKTTRDQFLQQFPGSLLRVHHRCFVALACEEHYRLPRWVRYFINPATASPILREAWRAVASSAWMCVEHCSVQPSDLIRTPAEGIR